MGATINRSAKQQHVTIQPEAKKLNAAKVVQFRRYMDAMADMVAASSRALDAINSNGESHSVGPFCEAWAHAVTILGARAEFIRRRDLAHIQRLIDAHNEHRKPGQLELVLAAERNNPVKDDSDGE
jgi:aspartokinase